MRQMREIVDVEFHGPKRLSDIIERLVAIQNSIDSDEHPEIRLAGDDLMGRKIQVLYWRDQTLHEKELDRRYGT